MVKGEYSIWTAEMGWTACARRSDAEETSDKPRYLILPSLWTHEHPRLKYRRSSPEMLDFKNITYFFN